MNSLKIVVGTDTGNTEYHAKYIKKELLEHYNIESEIVMVHDIQPEDWTSHDYYILGAPTWFDGEMSQDWNWYLPTFKDTNFTDKTIFIYGLGDQVGYPTYYCDAVGLLGRAVTEAGGSVECLTTTDGHDFKESQAVMTEGVFWGLCLDEENQPEMSDDRINEWVQNIARIINSKII